MGDPLTSLGVLWGALGGAEASLGIAVSAADSFAMYTVCSPMVSVVLLRGCQGEGRVARGAQGAARGACWVGQAE